MDSSAEGCSVAALLLQCSVVLFGWCCLPVHCDCAELNAGPLWYDGMVGANVDVFSWFWYWSILLSSALCFCRANLCGSAACCSAFCCWLAAVVQQPMAMSCWSCWNAFWLLWCGAVGLKLMSDVFVLRLLAVVLKLLVAVSSSVAVEDGCMVLLKRPMVGLKIPLAEILKLVESCCCQFQ
ncbi:hypothetical protein Nepgr_017385 [Nepenthes gracilis]|uniref:Secreted protein n=1 Tax=Nepenthes gracilis TaxID=150966 RepID=A0AAD3SRD2_NEPGR|nr:hypothetical protein Nepgr_017385 [Nepenthes gracilis]